MNPTRLDPRLRQGAGGVETGVRELALGSEPDAVPRARRFAGRATADAGRSQVASDVELVVTELVTNALLHAGLPVTVRISAIDDGVRVEVEDPSRHAPIPAISSTEAMTGRGLALVAAVAQTWGVDPGGTGKTVWCEIVESDPAEPSVAAELDVDALLAAWDDDEDAEQQYTIELGDVPTSLLLEAKSHVDNVVREFVLMASGAQSGHSAPPPPHLAELIEHVVHRFAVARHAIKSQAVAAARSGQVRTSLTLTLPASAADAGEEYVAALDEADSYARATRLLTLETPPQHRAFRRWYVESLVAKLRAASRGEPPPVTDSFEQRLLDELGAVATASRAAARAALLQGVTASLAAAATPEAVADIVLSEGVTALGATGGSVLQPSPDGGFLVSGVVGYASDVVEQLRSEREDTDLPAAVAMRTATPVWLESLAERDERFPQLQGMEPTTVAMCAVPMCARDRTLGALRFSFDKPRLFHESERQFVLALAAQAANALDRTELYAAERAARAAAEELSGRLARLQQVTSELAGARDVEDIAEILVTHAADALGARLALVMLLDDDTVRIVRSRGVPDEVARHFRTYPVSAQMPAADAIRSGRPVLVRDGEELAGRYPMLSTEFPVDGALIVVPLIAAGRRIGAIALAFPPGRSVDSGAELGFVTTLADTSAQAIERSRALAGLQRATEELAIRLAAIRRVAEAAQQAILAPVPPRIGPVRLAAAYVSAAAEARVGGDLYEVLPLDDCVRLLVGDVRGKGLQAVRTATVVLGEFRAAAVERHDVAAIARQMDARMRPYLNEEDFVTAVVAEIRADGTGQLVRCGHPPALITADGTVREVEATSSLPLGLGADPTPATFTLGPGGRLLLCTDGLFEARTANGAFVDTAAVVEPLGRGALDEVLDQVLAALRASAGEELGDDLALLVAEYDPQP